MASTCERCGGAVKLRRRHCAQCKTTIDELKRQYAHAAGRVLGVAGPLGPEWAELERWRETVGLTADDSRVAILDITSEWLRRYAVFAASDGVVTEEELSHFRRAAAVLKPAPELAHQIDTDLYRKFMLSSVCAGNLPRASAEGLHLPTDEHCYLNVTARRLRYLKSGVQDISGQLVVTNRKVRFIGWQRGSEMALSKLLNVFHANRHYLTLEATSNTMSGDYIVQDAEWAAAVIDTTLRIDRRTILPGSGRRTPIPQHVKTEVWQRDHGRCVQCDATDYLEFDHVIPRSRGGADTVGNIQLLCRRCNLAKSDKI